MTPIHITDHALERFHQRFGGDCDRDSLAAMLWACPIVRTGVQMARDETVWRAKIRQRNIQAVIQGNAVVTVYPIGGK